MINLNNQPIILVCSADENYAMPLAATVYSALVNLKNPAAQIILYILDGGIKLRTKCKIINSLKSNRIKINFVQPPEAMLVKMVVSEKYPLPVYYRLLAAQLIPQEFTKAIYLDTDLIVQGDLEQLWNIEIGENYVLAVQDPCHLYIGSHSRLKNYQQYGTSSEAKYLNSGVLVLNLEKWRSDNISQKIIAYLEQNQDCTQWLDQDGINAVTAGQAGELDPRWNQMHVIHEYSSWQDSPYPEDVYHQVRHHPYVVHYTTPPKPWQRGCQHPQAHLFFDYLDGTAWSGWRNTVWRRIWRRLLKEVNQFNSFSNRQKSIGVSSVAN